MQEDCTSRSDTFSLTVHLQTIFLINSLLKYLKIMSGPVAGQTDVFIVYCFLTNSLKATDNHFTNTEVM